MGGQGSGRKVDPIKQFQPQRANIASEWGGNSFELPNFSGLKSGSERLHLRNLFVGGEPSDLEFAHELDVHGHMEIEHTADEADDHALEINVNAAGFGDIKAVDIVYTTGAISAGEEEEVILINIDQSLATGGDIAGVEVIATEGSATIHGLEVGALVAPIEQISGVFSDMDRFLVKTSNETNNVKAGGGGNVTLFVADDDTITIGDTDQYEEIEFLLDITASGRGVAPTFEFSTGTDMWTTFTPSDGTNGFRNTGVVFFLLSDIPSWATGTNTEYLIRITRTRNTLTTTPRCDKVQIVKGTEFAWDKSGNITALSITANLIPNAEMDAGAHTIGFTQQSATGDGTTTIDWKLGNKFFFTFGSGNETFTFTAPTNPCNILLVLKQFSTGGKTATWPATVKWPGGTAPTLSTGNNDIDIVSFYFDGTNYYGVSSFDFS